MGFGLTQIINKVLKVSLTDSNGNLIQQPVDIQNVSQNIPVTVQNAPQGVATLNVYNTIAIIDTSSHNLSNSNLQWTNYGKIVLEFVSTLNQPVTITLVHPSYNNQPIKNYSGGTVNSYSVTIPAAASTTQQQVLLLTPTEWAILGAPYADYCNLTAQCATAPTQGSIIFKMNTFPIPT